MQKVSVLSVNNWKRVQKKPTTGVEYKSSEQENYSKISIYVTANQECLQVLRKRDH
ncbi:hypothetical protein [Lactiplantibacillus plantarum]|uniref:hypothetical protein n=1 Tax=Lactiplantibacillus plantarum TaxID=1590 RepID=UPI003F52EA02